MKVLITGTSGGIGRTIARRFLEEGHEVFGIDVREPSFAHENYRHFVCSVNDADLPELDGIGILISNAGVQGTADDIDVNLKGAINVCERYLSPSLKAVLFISSASALTGAEFPAYAASKAGLLGYMKNLARRLAPQGAVCNALCPGGVLTESNRPVTDDPEKWSRIMAATPLGKWMTEDECADWAVFLTLTNRSCTGQAILADNGEASIPVSTEFVW